MGDFIGRECNSRIAPHAMAGRFRRNHFAAPHSLQSFSVAFPLQRATELTAYRNRSTYLVPSTSGRAVQLKTKRPPKDGLSGLRDCYAFEDCAAAIAINVTTATTPKASNKADTPCLPAITLLPQGNNFATIKRSVRGNNRRQVAHSSGNKEMPEGGRSSS